MSVQTDTTVRPDATGEPIEVRRNAALLLLVAAGSLAMAAAYGWRAAQGSAGVLWVVVAALVVIGLLHLVAWFDARTPLLVADAHGVRLRAGREWQGLTWSSIDRVELEPRPGLFRDGRIVVVPEEGGDDLRLPIGLATAARAEEVVRGLTGLARDRTAVSVRVSPRAAPKAASGFDPIDDTELAPGWSPALVPDAYEDGAPHSSAEEYAASREAASNEAALQDAASNQAPSNRDEKHDGDDADPDAGSSEPPKPSRSPGDLGPGWADIPPRFGRAVPAVRGAGRAVRADITRTAPASLGTLALERHASELPEAHELRGTDGRVGLVIEPTPAIDEPVEAVPEVAAPEPEELEWSGEPASDPLIGPTLREAREHLHLSVDSLADRTRIRPHVIESIETDDFAPCGGDFYARGHLRSLARVLGVEADDLIRTYDAAYAHAPIEARRVFEAELATGPRPSIRLTSGGPNWAALIGVVLVLAIIWGAAQYLTGGDESDGGSDAGGTAVPAVTPAKHDDKANDDLARFGAPSRNRIALTGRGAGSDVVVRGEDGSAVWRGTLRNGQVKRLDVAGKATIEVKRGPGVRAGANGDKPELIGGRSGDRRAVLGKR